MFTNSYPWHHRPFTLDRTNVHKLTDSLSERSSRSYYGDSPTVPRMANVAIPERKPVLVFGNLEIRPDELQALAKGVRVGLTVREFQVLLVLARREDHVVRRTDIYDQVWGGEMKQRDRSVDVFVRKLRNKLARAAPDWVYIHTHFGIGYRFAAMPLGEETASHDELATDVRTTTESQTIGRATVPVAPLEETGLAG
jgi:DNA-binding winged helix-turn-helix (wHTH) protein